MERVNPMNLHLILEQVFQHSTSLECVKRNRLVNRIWCHTSNSQWLARNKTLALFRKRSVSNTEEDPVTKVQNLTLEQLQQICANPENSLRKLMPLMKVQLRYWLFDNELLYNLDNYQAASISSETWFWNCIAPTAITNLELLQCSFETDIVVFKEPFLSAFPNLEILTVTSAALFDQAKAEICMFSNEWDFRKEMNQKVPYQHQNLRVLNVKINLRSEDDWWPSYIWGPFFEAVPKLEEICLRWDDDRHQKISPELANGLLAYTEIEQVAHSLKTLDLIDLSAMAVRTGIERQMPKNCPIPNFKRLEVLKYDLGFQSQPSDSDGLQLFRKAPLLKTLHLYRAPFNEPLSPSQFLGDLFMENLTELNLWGNVCSSLAFLNEMPNLKALTWNTSCYEGKYHGKRLHSLLKPEEGQRKTRPYPMMGYNLLENVKEFGTLEDLAKLEVDWTWITSSDWGNLGKWMPNLKSLKTVVKEQKELDVIIKQWPQVEELTLAHGSSLEIQGILQSLVELEHLRKFVWKGCPCNEKSFREKCLGLEQNSRDLYAKIKERVSEQVIFPWDSVKEEKMSTLPEKVKIPEDFCIQAEFERGFYEQKTVRFFDVIYPKAPSV